MKQAVILFIGLWLLCGCSFAQSQLKNKELQEFVIDLSSANTKLKGKLLLFGQYKNDLSTLTFDRYLQLLKENESVSDKGIAEAIRNADQHLFTSSKNTFSIAIYSKELNAIVYDDANSAFIDSVKPIENEEKLPSLNEFVSKSRFINSNK